MNEVATYIRCQINGKWTNLGLIAEEGEIQEHFEFVEGLLKEKQRADELEKRWNELREHVIARSDVCKERRMIRERDALIDVMAAMHDLEEDDNA